MVLKNEMLTPDEVATRILAGDVMVIAGDETLLAGLPKGNWVGGTTVYFVTESGGAMVRDRLFCTTFSQALSAHPRHLTGETLPQIADGYAADGFTIIMIPAFSQAHSQFAIEGANYPGLFNQPLLGWITGVHLEEIGSRSPKVVDGQTGTLHAEGAVLLHVTLTPGSEVTLDILNIFSQGDDAALTFTFPKGGFTAREALVNGKTVNLAQYITENAIDTRLPLVANYAGALVNVSVQAVEEEGGLVKFYAPVVDGLEYRQARTLGNYAEAFAQAAQTDGKGQFSCNCILNYLYGDLEGKPTGQFTGPVTFGEIAYILLNQTLVHLAIKPA